MNKWMNECMYGSVVCIDVWCVWNVKNVTSMGINECQWDFEDVFQYIYYTNMGKLKYSFGQDVINLNQIH